jgi:tetratricopeptide (TPR) repeat protein
MANETASREGGTSYRAALAVLERHKLPIVVFAVAFLVRLAYLVSYSTSPFFQVHIADALFHEDWAKRILGGDIFSLRMQGVLYKAPLYPYFLALAYWMSGTSNFVVMFLQVIMTALSCLLLFLIGKRYFGVSAGLVGALVYGFYFPSLYFSTEMEIPAIAIFLTLLSFYLLTAERRGLASIVCPTVFGLSLLALPSNLLLLPLYLVVPWRKQKTARQGIKRALLFAAVVLATILPCTLRNLIAGKHLTLISANGGINFYIGNNERYDQTVYLQPGYAFEAFYDEPRRIAGASSFADRDRYWYRKAFDFIGAHPAQEALLVLKKLALYLADYEIYRNTDTYYAKANSIYRHIPFVPASLILASGLCGLVLAIRDKKGMTLAAFCALQALPCLIFFVTDRYRLPSMTIWAVFSGFFVTSLASMIRDRAWSRGGGAVAVATCIVIASNLNLFVVRNPEYRPHLNLGFICESQTKYDLALKEYGTALDLVTKARPRDIQIESELLTRLGNVQMSLSNLEAARESFQQALAVNPNSVPAYSYLGTLYHKQGQSERAVELFNRAIEIDRFDVVSIYNLGLVYLANQQIDQALARFHRVIELAPEHSGAHNSLAYLHGMQGRRDLAEDEAKKAIYFNPKEASARYNLASIYLDSGRVEEARAQYRAITEASPRESSNAYNQLGVMSAQQNDLRQALEYWQKALEVDPTNQDALANVQQATRMMR